MNSARRTLTLHQHLNTIDWIQYKTLHVLNKGYFKIAELVEISGVKITTDSTKKPVDVKSTRETKTPIDELKRTSEIKEEKEEKEEAASPQFVRLKAMRVPHPDPHLDRKYEAEYRAITKLMARSTTILQENKIPTLTITSSGNTQYAFFANRGDSYHYFDKALSEKHTIPAAEIKSIIAQLFIKMNLFFHQKKTTHLDIKLENIFLYRDKSGFLHVYPEDLDGITKVDKKTGRPKTPDKTPLSTDHLPAWFNFKNRRKNNNILIDYYAFAHTCERLSNPKLSLFSKEIRLSLLKIAETLKEYLTHMTRFTRHEIKEIHKIIFTFFDDSPEKAKKYIENIENKIQPQPKLYFDGFYFSVEQHRFSPFPFLPTDIKHIYIICEDIRIQLNELWKYIYAGKKLEYVEPLRNMHKVISSKIDNAITLIDNLLTASPFPLTRKQRQDLVELKKEVLSTKLETQKIVKIHTDFLGVNPKLLMGVKNAVTAYLAIHDERKPQSCWMRLWHGNPGRVRARNLLTQVTALMEKKNISEEAKKSAIVKEIDLIYDSYSWYNCRNNEESLGAILCKELKIALESLEEKKEETRSAPRPRSIEHK